MKIVKGIGSSTHIDLQGDRVTKEALDNMVLQVHAKYIPVTVEHDYRHKIGVVLCADVVASGDGEWLLRIVQGHFENELEASLFMPGNPNTVWRDYLHELNGINPPVNERGSKGIVERGTVHPTDIAARLEAFLESTSVWEDGSVYHIKHFISSIRDLEVHVWPKDHNPEHFHVISKQRGIDARFDLTTLDHLSDKKGHIRSRDIKRVKAFFAENPDVLAYLRKEHARITQ